MARFKQPTTTSLVTSALREADDFMNMDMLIAATGRQYNQCSAALHVLRLHRVVDVVIQPNGIGWWFALPPEEDNRCRCIDERAPETKPRVRRKKGAKIPSNLA